MAQKTVRVDVPQHIAAKLIYDRMKDEDFRTFVTQVLDSNYRLDFVMNAIYGGVPKSAYGKTRRFKFDNKVYTLKEFRREEYYNPYLIVNVDEDTDEVSMTLDKLIEGAKTYDEWESNADD